MLFHPLSGRPQGRVDRLLFFLGRLTPRIEFCDLGTPLFLPAQPFGVQVLNGLRQLTGIVFQFAQLIAQFRGCG